MLVVVPLALFSLLSHLLFLDLGKPKILLAAIELTASLLGLAMDHAHECRVQFNPALYLSFKNESLSSSPAKTFSLLFAAMAFTRFPDKHLHNLKLATKMHPIFCYVGPSGSGKLELLKQGSKLPVIDFHLDFTLNAENIDTWCKRNLFSSLLGPVVKVIKNAELISCSALSSTQDFVKKNKTDRVILVSCDKLPEPSLPVVYHAYLPVHFREFVALENGCPPSMVTSLTRQCDQDLRQLIQRSRAVASNDSLHAADPCTHVSFNTGDIFAGKFNKVPEDSYKEAWLHENYMKEMDGATTLDN